MRFLSVSRMGQHKDGRAGGLHHHGAELCAQGPTVPAAGAEVRYQSPGEYTALLISLSVGIHSVGTCSVHY